LRFHPAISAAGLDQILHLALGYPHRQLFACHPADAEENDHESDGGSNPEHTAADSFSSFFCHSVAPEGQYIRRVPERVVASSLRPIPGQMHVFLRIVLEFAENSLNEGHG
jgi:hypothetical protein